MIESNLFIVVACMSAFYAILHKAWTTAASGYSNGTKDSYFSNADRSRKSGASLPYGVISKSTDVKIYNREESGETRGSDSDVKLVL
jgi:hypothetical protein